jgi:DNA-binding CsgD family transcriptional regulator
VGKPTGKRETRTIVVGPDGKRFAFPASMPREEMRDRMRAAYAEETRIAQEKVKRAGIDREATAAGRAEGERAASRMGVNTPFEMAMAAPAIGMAQQSGGRPVYDREGIVLPDEAAGMSALNSAGFFIPGMVNQQFGKRVAESRRQEPGFALAGDVAGGVIPGQLIGQGIAQVGKMIAPQFARLGSMLKGKPEDAPLVLGPESRIRPIDRPDALPGDDVLTAKALDQWTPPPEQQVRPMGFGAGKPPKAPPTDFEDFAGQLAQKDFKPARITREATEADLAETNNLVGDAITQWKDVSKTTDRVFRQVTKDTSAPDQFPETVVERLQKAILRSRGLDPDPLFARMTERPRAEGWTNAKRDRTGKTVKYYAGEAAKADARSDMSEVDQAIDYMSGLNMKDTKPNSILTERGKDAVEQTFGAAYMSGTGSVAGGQYDLNGDGQIDNADLAIGSGIGLAAFASPLALRKVAELGGRLKGTRAPADGDDINPAGFGSPAPRRTEAFMDDRLTPSENKALEMRRNGFSTEEIAEEMDTSTNTVLKFISTAKSKGVEVEPIKRGPPMNRTPDVLRLAEQGLRPIVIAERLGLTRNNVSVLLTKERTRLKNAGKPIPKWLSQRDPGGNMKEVN